MQEGKAIMYKHIIWDFDGTLFDTYPMMTDAFLTTLKEDGIKELYENIISLMKISEPHLMQYCKNKYDIKDDFKERYYRYKDNVDKMASKPFINVPEICKHIILTGNKNYLYTHRDVSAIEYLKVHGLYDYFSDFITGENSFKRKPDPQALLFLIDKHNMNKKEAIMIGDRDIDILAAKNAGIKACFFSNGQSKESEYADYNIQDFNKLYGIIACEQ